MCVCPHRPDADPEVSKPVSVHIWGGRQTEAERAAVVAAGATDKDPKRGLGHLSPGLLRVHSPTYTFFFVPN